MTSSTGAAPSAQKWLVARLGLVAIVMTCLFLGIMYKAWTVQIRDHERMKALGHAQYLHELEVPAPRGPIVDANGVELAISVEVQSLFANPREVPDPVSAARALANVIDLPQRELENKLASGRRFVWLKRRLSPPETAAVRKLQLEGIGLSPEAQRFYPAGNLAGPLLGVAGLDGHGLEGVELAMDEHLAGERAKVPVLRDGRGKVLLAGWEESDAHAVAGDTIVLTIDRFIQFAAERALLEAIEENKAKSGVVVVLDARTSDVLAMATYPTYDPNAPGKRDGARNRPVTDTYEPGSGMKVFTVAAALEAGAVSADESFAADGGRITIGRKTIKDTHFEKPYLTVGEIIKYSSNVGAVKIARRIGKEKLAEELRAFGFGAQTGIDLPGERSGVVRDVKKWGEIGLATTSFGYGLTVTPLQLASALAAIARGGEWLQPHVIKEVRGADGKVKSRPERKARRVLSEQNAQAMMGMLEMVMQEGGTGEKIAVPGFRVAGKTGTAHKVDPATRKYSPNRYLSSFIGVAPANDPRLVVVVMLDEPSSGKYYGGAVAGPVFARIAIEVLKYMGIPGTEPILPPRGAAGKDGGKVAGKDAAAKDTAKPEAAKAAPAAAPLERDAPMESADEVEGDLPPAGPGQDIVVIPDFTGMSVAQAVAAARAAGVTIEIEGSGRAVKQFPAAGRAMKSITCRITFDPG